MSQTLREEIRRRAEIIQAGCVAAVERFCAEAEFVEGLADLHPSKARAWRGLLERACGVVAAAARTGGASRVDRAVREAEGVLAPVARVAKTYTVHCVGHAHIDMNWMWSWPETVAVTNDTFTTVLKLMEEFPDFCFVQSQASVYAIARRYCPELLAGIRRRIAEGRWEVAACHWVEGDKNIAGGEALARHLLYTRRFCREELGLEVADVPLDWEPDTFGHAATIPSIVSRGGVRRYYLCRGGQGWDKPAVFWWAGPDGARVLVNREVTWYNDHVGPHNIRGLLRFCRETHLRDWLCVFGVGDHGGGPTRRDILRCREMDAWPVFPRFRLATTRAYFELLEKRAADWPTLQRELNFEFTGCYTSQSRIKRFNRLSEALLDCAEAAAVLAERAAGRAYPAAELREAWIETLFSHFHDILPGSGVRETREYNSGQFQQVAATTGMVTTHSLRAVAAGVDTSMFAGDEAPGGPAHPAGGRELGAGSGHGAYWGGVSSAAHAAGERRVFAVFNPCAWPRSETVKLVVWDTGERATQNQAFAVRLADGRLLPAQKLQSGKGRFWGHDFVDLAVPVSVEGLGWMTLAVEPAGRRVPGGDDGYPAFTSGAAGDLERRHAPAVTFAEPLTMENEHVRVRLDGATGGIVELADKASGVDVADGQEPAGVLEYCLERPGGMTAWTIQPFQRRICPLEVASIQKLAAGPHLAAVAVKAKINDSTATLTYSLRAGLAFVEIDVEVDWLERGSPSTGTPSLRLRVPLALRDARAAYEIPFGAVERAEQAGQEVPALRWADVTGVDAGGKPCGCTLLNDCKHGHSLDGRTLALTLIRSSYDPDPLPEMGRHVVRLALAPHGRRPTTADLVRMGAAFNQPLRVVSTDAHAGPLPPAAGAVRGVRPAGVVLSAVKKAEDGESVVFRLHETAGRAAAARVSLDSALLGRVVAAEEVDLLERCVTNGSAGLIDGGFKVNIPAHGIAGVKVRLER